MSMEGNVPVTSLSEIVMGMFRDYPQGSLLLTLNGDEVTMELNPLGGATADSKDQIIDVCLLALSTIHGHADAAATQKHILKAPMIREICRASLAKVGRLVHQSTDDQPASSPQVTI